MSTIDFNQWLKVTIESQCNKYKKNHFFIVLVSRTFLQFSRDLLHFVTFLLHLLLCTICYTYFVQFSSKIQISHSSKISIYFLRLYSFDIPSCINKTIALFINISIHITDEYIFYKQSLNS